MTDDTEFGPQIAAQAWSAGDPVAEVAPYREHHRWSAVLSRAAIVLAGGTLVGATILLGLGDPDSTATVVVRSPAPVVELTADPPPRPFVMPTVMAAHQTQDGDYLHRLRVAGIEINDPPQAILFAHTACADLARGFTTYQMAMANYEHFHDTTVPALMAQIDIAASVYCPRRY